MSRATKLATHFLTWLLCCSFRARAYLSPLLSAAVDVRMAAACERLPVLAQPRFLCCLRLLSVRLVVLSTAAAALTLCSLALALSLSLFSHSTFLMQPCGKYARESLPPLCARFVPVPRQRDEAHCSTDTAWRQYRGIGANLAPDVGSRPFGCFSAGSICWDQLESPATDWPNGSKPIYAGWSAATRAWGK